MRGSLGWILLVAVILGASPAAPPGAGDRSGAKPDVPPRSAEGAGLKRLTPPDHDAVRPRLSRDGRTLAYVRRVPLDLSTLGSPGKGGQEGRAGEDLALAATTAPDGEEIWTLDLETGRGSRRVGRKDLEGHGLRSPGYSLHDLSWAPDGGRLAFAWYDGVGWGQVVISDPGGRLVRIPPPSMSDPWEGGEAYLLSTAQFTWEEDGGHGFLVAWDDECGSLYRLNVPPVGSADRIALSEIPLPGGCRLTVLEAPGWWLYRSREEDFSQRISIVGPDGSVAESKVFPEGPAVYARWGAAPGEGRPPVVGWKVDRERDEAVIFVWEPGSLTTWRREACAAGCPEPLLLTPEGIYYLAAPMEEGRLMRLRAPGTAPEPIVEAGVTALRSSADGGLLIAAIEGPDGLVALWRLAPAPADPGEPPPVPAPGASI